MLFAHCAEWERWRKKKIREKGLGRITGMSLEDEANGTAGLVGWTDQTSLPRILGVRDI